MPPGVSAKAGPRTVVSPPAPRAWRSSDVLRVVTIVVGVYLALQVLWAGRTILFIAFIGVLFGLALTAAVDRLQAYRVPRGVAAPLIVLSILGALVGAGLLLAPKVTAQLQDVQREVPQVIDRLESWVDQRVSGVVGMLREQPEGSKPTGSVSIRQTVSGQIGKVGGAFLAVFSSTLAALGALLLILFTSIFVAIDPGLYHRGLMHLFPHSARPRAGEVLSAVAVVLRRWLLTQLVAMLVIGVVTTIVLLLLGVQAAVALGIIAGLLEFIPYVGPIFSAVPAVAMALVSGPETALYVILAYIGIQQMENHLLIPLLMKEGVDLPPVLTVLGQALMAVIFGFLGVLTAVPLMAGAMVPIKMLYVEGVVGDEVTVLGEEDG
ncbi:MAG TPA: AI-2E family transporter [Gemmatimonadales bacterium]|nr:AI-2E family transporter [Gemmatimonadales bacterium]